MPRPLSTRERVVQACIICTARHAITSISITYRRDRQGPLDCSIFGHISVGLLLRCSVVSAPSAYGVPLRRLEVSTASKSLPRMRLSWLRSLSFQRLSDTPEKNQGLPLSARIIPYSFIAFRMTLLRVENPLMLKEFFSRKIGR